MRSTSLLKHWLPPAVTQVIQRLRRGPGDMERYIRGGRVPWSHGYSTYRADVVRRTLADPALMASFRAGGPLPAGYGMRVDERCVEYPWVFSRLTAPTGRLLDAGSTFNHAHVLEQPQLSGATIHILTLGPEEHCFWHRGISYLYADLRDIPTRDGFYDVAVCLSTLEHVGFDNAWITQQDRHRESRPDDFVRAMQELRRVLTPGGRLLLTVPFGVSEDLGTQQIFDDRTLARAIDAFEPAMSAATSFFRYAAEGWQIASREDCRGCRYEPWIMLLPHQRSAQFKVPLDGAAAARAVACVELGT